LLFFDARITIYFDDLTKTNAVLISLEMPSTCYKHMSFRVYMTESSAINVNQIQSGVSV